MLKKILTLCIVVLAGETIFMQPFLVPRLYRSLMLENWGITNLDLGVAFSAYGVSAMISYVLGGPFADKYEPRGLMVISLISTGLASCLLLNNPSQITLTVTYCIYGVSTILLMWSAMIKVTHEIGGEKNRSSAMGILEGGRGLVTAVMSSFLVFIVGTQSSAEGVILDKNLSLKTIYISISVVIFLVSILVWFGLKNVETKEARANDWTFEKVIGAVKNPNLWLLSVIILCAYCSYKNIGIYPIYLKDVKQMNIQESSTFTSYIFWLRPIAAIVAGVLADKLAFKVSGGRFVVLILSFILASITQVLLGLDVFPEATFVLSTILFTTTFAYALRAIYFSVFGAFKIKDSFIGTTVGIVSLVGFLPDFFFGAFTGYLIDEFPGQLGYSYVFYFNGILLAIGAVAAVLCYRRTTRL